MPGSYCAATDVANLLGVTFTTAQTAECTVLISYATAYIDRETRRGWLIPPITAERYDLIEPILYLRYRPVTSVELIQTRSQEVGDILYTAIAGTDYELFDADMGQVNFVSGYASLAPYGVFGSLRKPAVAFVSYTPNLGTVPADIVQAATMIVASTMQYQLQPGAYGTDEVRFGRMTGLTFADEAVRLLIPQTARAIIANYRRPIMIA